GPPPPARPAQGWVRRRGARPRRAAAGGAPVAAPPAADRPANLAGGPRTRARRSGSRPPGRPPAPDRRAPGARPGDHPPRHEGAPASGEAAAVQVDPEMSGHPGVDHVNGDAGGRAIFERWLVEVARAPRGERGHTLYRAGLRLFSLAAGGALDHREVEAGLLAAAEAAGLLTEEPSHTRRTLAPA